MNDWDYDVTPNMCQYQREKNETRKELQEGDGWDCGLQISRGLMTGGSSMLLG